MATKNFNPMKDAPSALQYLLMLTPPEVRQQAIRATSVVKTALDQQKVTENERAILLGQTEVLRQQIVALKAELASIQFSLPEESAPEEKKRGRKPNVNG